MWFKQKRPKIRPLSLSTLTWKRFRQNFTGMAALIFLVFMIVIAILGYLLTPDSSPWCNRQQLEIALQSPGFKTNMLYIKQPYPVPKRGCLARMLWGQPDTYKLIPVKNYKQQGDSLYVQLFEIERIDEYKVFPLANLREGQPVEEHRFWLGTDRYGRDVLSQLMIGSRVSLMVGFISVLIAIFIGVIFGSIAGFYGGKVDDLLMFVLNVIWSIPTLLLVIAISFALGKGFWQIFMAIGLTMWVDVARVVRGQVISLREQEFIEAGRALGFSNIHLIFKHVIPQVMGSVIVLSASNFSSAILMEAGLSFLGLGVAPPTPSWGMMMRENYAYIVLNNAYLAIAPGIAMMLLVLAFMLVGSALRDALDVQQA
ncbi:MAG: ABC transporter permease [Bacteroidales bacterium]|jgi:peptide/nickel transport system permease protein|nr:ABC transporter permease [Bacteroidales bacterium]